MRVLEELLPFGILIAITIVGKILESRKRKRIQEQARDVQQPTPDSYDEEESYEEEPTFQEPVRESPTAPPVAAMPEGLRNILRNFGVEVAIPPPPPIPKVEQPVVHSVRHVRKEIVVPVPEVHKPKFEVNPEALRAGILWKYVLDKPRAHQPWQPL